MKLDDVSEKYPVLEKVVERIKDVDKIDKLFPPQAEAIKTGCLKGINLVLAIPTCSGKTLCAELAMLKTILEKKRKAIYLVPLKALAMEKYREFKEKYEPLGIKVAISIGDYDSSDAWLANYDIIVTSNEKCDSLLRHNSPWFSEIGIVVADEIHLLNDPSRGPTLEVILTRLRQLTDPNILALSATINNYEELSKWLGAKSVKSDYRPVKLYRGVCFDKRIDFIPKRSIELNPNEAELKELVEQTIRKGKQALVFISTRRVSESTAEKIARVVKDKLAPRDKKKLTGISDKMLGVLGHPTVQCHRLSGLVRDGVAFHHAGLANKQRNLIEEAFKEGLIKVITATPTLCLHSNTKIWNGMSEHSIEKVNNGNELFVLDGDKIKKLNPIGISEMESPHQLVNITTKLGNRICLTGNHRILAKRYNRKLLIRAEDCKPWDRIATIGKIKLDSVKSNLWSDFVRENKLPFGDKLLDSDIYYLIGVFLGDGHSGAERSDERIIYKGSPSIVNEDEIIIEKVKSICGEYKIFCKETKNAYGTTQLILSKSKWFREFLVRCGIDVGTKKHISERLLESDEKHLSNLIRGLFDTDGYVHKERNVGISSISFRMIKEIQRSLLRYGIISRIRKREGKTCRLHKKTYKSKEYWEIIIANTKCLKRFHENIGFCIPEKSKKLNNIINRLKSNLLTVECNRCNYILHPSMFTGRTKSQILWGDQKRYVINLLGEKGAMKSNDLKHVIGFPPRKNDTRLNHHYELIRKRKSGANECIWELNKLGMWVYKEILCKGKDLREYFTTRANKCPFCEKELIKKERNNWRGNDFEGDIFWDRIRVTRKVRGDGKVYDVVLPDDGSNDHVFVANGFLVHNSAGINMPAWRVIVKDLKRFDAGRGMDYIPVLEAQQIMGRAGRLKFDSEGEAILLTNNKKDAEYAWNNYIKGEPEKIFSKLGVEPVLRTHVLSLIASGVTPTRESLFEFFSKTFYAYQYKDLGNLEKILKKIISLLEEFRFITTGKGEGETGPFKSGTSLLEEERAELKPTRIGKRVSELYIDPLTANHLIGGLGIAKERGVNDFACLHMISNTLEMMPLPNIRKSDMEGLNEIVVKEEKNLIQKPPNPWDIEYDDFLRSLKNAWLLMEWCDEAGEDKIMDRFGVTPGELRVRLKNTDWLLYATQELGLLLGYMGILKDIRKARLRVKYGVRKDLLPLVKLKGIGRVRARQLWNSGLRTLDSLRKIPLTSLERIIGPKTARQVKQQLE